MATYLRIDDSADLAWLRTLIANSLARDPNNQTLQVNFVQISNWDRYLRENVITVAEAVEAAGTGILAESDQAKIAEREAKRIAAEKQKQREKAARAKGIKPRKPRAPKVDVDPYVCAEHPDYGAKRAPRTSCERCWSIYKSLHLDRYLEAWTKFQRRQKDM